MLSGVDGLGIGSRSGDMDRAADHVMAGFDSIDPHPDVAAGLRALAGSGNRLVTLSNGAAAVATSMLRRHGVADCVTHILSVEDAGAWKPHPRAYGYAAERTATPAGDLLMVAAHPWDLDGAARAGLQTAFLDRTGAPWPSVFRSPDLHVHSPGARRAAALMQRPQRADESVGRAGSSWWADRGPRTTEERT